MSHAVFNESACGICVGLWLASSAHRYLPLFPRLRGSSGPPGPRAAQSHERPLKTDSTTWQTGERWGDGGKWRPREKWNREQLIITQVGYYGLAVSVPSVPRWNVGVRRNALAG